jgi:hypothetical protein
LRALRSGETSFQGEDTCQGSGTPGGCPRVLRFEAVASYRPNSVASANIHQRQSQASSAG